MKPYLRILNQNFAAGQNFARLPLAGNFLRVLAAPAPFTFTLGDESTVDLVPGMGVFLSEEQAFQVLRINRSDATGAAVLQIAVGFQPADKPLVLTDNRAVADIKNSVTVEDARKINLGNVISTQATRRARFMPKITAALNMLNEVKYFTDHTAAPKITASTPAALNLLAPLNLSSRKRVIRLLSGASASVGFGEGAPGPSVPGHAVTLTAANPEMEIDGAEALFGISESDCTLSVLEITESALGVLEQLPAQIEAHLSADEIALLPAPTLAGSVSFSWEPGCTTTVQSYTPTTDGLAVAAHFSGAVRNWPNSADGVNVLHSMSFSGVTLAMMANYLAAFGPASTATVAQKNPFANSVHWRFLLNGAGTINFSTGQKFTYSDANGSTYFRVIFHYDGRVWAQKFNTVTNLWEGGL